MLVRRSVSYVLICSTIIFGLFFQPIGVKYGLLEAIGRVGRIGDLYRRALALFMDRPSRFSWIDEMVAGSGRPMSQKQVEWIKERGINVIISLTEDPLPREWIGGMGLDYRHFPIEDHSAPSPETLKQIVDEILEYVRLSLIHI